METQGSQSTNCSDNNIAISNMRPIEHRADPRPHEGNLEKALREDYMVQRGPLLRYLGKVHQRVSKWAIEMDREQQLSEEQEHAIRSPINKFQHHINNSSFGGQQGSLPIFSNSRRGGFRRPGHIHKYQAEEARGLLDAIDHGEHEKSSSQKKRPKQGFPSLSHSRKGHIIKVKDMSGDKRAEFEEVEMYIYQPPNPTHAKEEWKNALGLKLVQSRIQKLSKGEEKRGSVAVPVSVPAASKMRMHSLDNKPASLEKRPNSRKPGMPPTPIIVKTNYESILNRFNPLLKKGQKSEEKGPFRLK